MKNKAFTLIELLVVITVSVVLFLMLIFAFSKDKDYRDSVNADATSKEEAGLWWTESLSRASFENHNYVILRNGGAGIGIFHDPDCPCGK